MFIIALSKAYENRLIGDHIQNVNVLMKIIFLNINDADDKKAAGKGHHFNMFLTSCKEEVSIKQRLMMGITNMFSARNEAQVNAIN